MDPDQTLPAEPGEDAHASGDRPTDPGGQTTDLGAGPPVAHEAVIPERIGRYVVTGRIGAGGMGVVLEAHDQALDRPVAIKLLHSRDRASDRTRLLREALALAQLSHPHVVQIFEVGVWDGRAFLVMERVDGVSLGQWLAAEPRRVRAIVDVFVQAGEGLAAAHVAGFVHRDFKPGNVLVGTDGRVRVLDFGLARADTTGHYEHEPVSETPLPAAWNDMTQAGAMMGTPAYMSPEHFGMQPATAASDQFSFCVALYEALFHQHPFGEPESWQERMNNVLTGQIRPLPEQARTVPRRLQKAVLRGLHDQPDRRWPSMHALLRELRAAGRSARRWRWAAIAAPVAVLLGSGVWMMSPGRSHGQAQPCTGAQAKLAEVWGLSQHQAVEQALRGTGLAYAEQTWQRVDQELDAYAEQWGATHARACEERSHDPAVLDQRMACLERLRGALQTQVQVLAEADATVVEQAVTAVTGLREPGDCLEPDAVDAPPSDDPRVVARHQALMEQLDRVDALLRSGRYDAALETAERALEAAQALGHSPSEASALLRLGEAQQHSHELDDASESLKRAYFLARQGGLGQISRRAATDLVVTIGVDQQDYERGMEWARHAEAGFEQGGDDASRSRFFGSLGLLLVQRGEYDQALQTLERGLALCRTTSGCDASEASELLGHIGIVHRKQGRAERAIEYQQRALALVEQVVGPEHPRVANALSNLAAAYVGAGRLVEAEHTARRSLALAEALRGPDAPENSTVFNTLGIILMRQDRHEEAEKYLVRALELLGDDSLLHTRSLLISNIGLTQHWQGQHDRAAQTFRRSITLFEAAGLDRHSDLVSVSMMLARTLKAAGEYEEAEAVIERARSIIEDTSDRPSPVLFNIYTTLATLGVAQGRPHEAKVHLERALSLGKTVSISEPLQASFDFVLAQVQWELEPRRRSEALTMARDAARVAESHGPRLAPLRDQIRAWRAEHDPAFEPTPPTPE